MAHAAEATQKLPVRDPNRYSLRPIFLNWPLSEPGLDGADVFDARDLASYDLIFFDPYHFAVDHELWKDSIELSEGQYISIDEQGLLKFLAIARKATEQLQKAVEKGATLVIRARIPNSHLSVRKRSTVGTSSYTSSVISSFFWLEPIVGKFSMRISNAQTIRYRDSRHALKRVMGDCAVVCRQTQEALSTGRRRVVATAGGSDQPAITKVSFENWRGSVYFVPEFQIQGETDKLIRAMIKEREATTDFDDHPDWMRTYDSHVGSLISRKYSTESVDEQIAALEKQRSVILSHQQTVNQLGDLLHDHGPEFAAAVESALGILGFNLNPGKFTSGSGFFDGVLAGDRTSQVLVRYVATPNSHIGVPEVEAISTALASHQLEVAPKSILVFNPFSGTDPMMRQQWLETEVVSAARRDNICLLPSYELFVAAYYLLGRWDSESIQNVTFALRRDLLECDSLFQLNRIKYAVDMPTIPALARLASNQPTLITPTGDE